jgi:hypothetical protein
LHILHVILRSAATKNLLVKKADPSLPLRLTGENMVQQVPVQQMLDSETLTANMLLA